jgi:hypothetical protein
MATSTRYQFRARRSSRAGLATQQGTLSIPNPVTNVIGSQIPLEATRGIADAMTVHPALSVRHAVDSSQATNPVRSYSDVAASRPSSPATDDGKPGAANPLPRSNVQSTKDEVDNSVITTSVDKDISAATAVHNNDDDSSLSDPSEPDENPNPWIRVVPRRSRSLGSLSHAGTKVVEFETIKSKNLTKEQSSVVKQAEQKLTTEQKQKISRRYENASKIMEPNERHPSHNEGPSNRKGKGPDPKNWGAVDLSDSELNMEAQKAALDSFAQKKLNTDLVHYNSSDAEDEPVVKKQPKKKASKNSEQAKAQKSRAASERHTPQVDDHKKAQLERTARNNEPSNQIAPKSYLGRALEQLDKNSRRRRHRHRDSGSDSSSNYPSGSDDSFGSSDSSDSDSDMSSSSQNSRQARKRPRHRSKSRRKHRRARSSKKSKMLIKPIPPTEYDGAADARAYHRFVTEGTEYITSGKVGKKQCAFVLSYYLTGKAYDFYTQKVSLNYKNWTLHEFFVQLFNYCFPSDYRLELRKKVKSCYQNNKSVAEYSHELDELYNMIGVVDEREKIIKFWNGFRASIQRTLWLNGYNPEVSTWDEIQRGAEIIETSEKVSDPQRRNNSGGGNNHQNNNNNGGHHGKKRSGSKLRSDFQRRGSQAPSSQRNHSLQPSTSRFQSPRFNGNSRAQNNHSNHKHDSKSKDNKREHTPKLTDKEKAELLASGSCFNCKEKGHLSRNCPRGNFIKSSNGKKPPGLASYNIEVIHDEPLVLDSLELNAISLDEDPFSWMNYGPDWASYDPNEPRRDCMGDALALMAQHVLDVSQPYPGDSNCLENTHGVRERFGVRPCLDPNWYRIFDNLTKKISRVPSPLLKNPYFRLGEWYARLRAKQVDSLIRPYRPMTMGGAYEHNASLVLRSGIPTLYPTHNPDVDDELRFTVVQAGLDEYSIGDDDFDEFLLISGSALRNIHFDLANWYRTHRYPKSAISSSSDDEGFDFKLLDAVINPSPTWENVTDLSDCDLSLEFDDSTSIPDLQSVSDLSEFTDDLPDLQSVSDSDVEELSSNYATTDHIHTDGSIIDEDSLESVFDSAERPYRPIGEVLGNILARILTACEPYPGDHQFHYSGGRRFKVVRIADDTYRIHDLHQQVYSYLPAETVRDPEFEPSVWYTWRCSLRTGITHQGWSEDITQLTMAGVLEREICRRLREGIPYRPDETYPIAPLAHRFEVFIDPLDNDLFLIQDLQWDIFIRLPRILVEQPEFDVADWYNDQLEEILRQYLADKASGSPSEHQSDSEDPPDDGSDGSTPTASVSGTSTVTRCHCAPVDHVKFTCSGGREPDNTHLGLYGVQVPRGTYPAVQRNAAATKDPSRIVPRPIVVTVKVNGHPARALLDSGSLGDFIASTAADQLNVKRVKLNSPLSLQLAVQGSRSKINAGAKIRLDYQGISEERYLDIINISGYDLILGTPWWFQHQVCVGFNPARVVIGSDISLPLTGPSVTEIASRAVALQEDEVTAARNFLKAYAEPLCKTASETELPPLRVINHTIPLKDKDKVYQWRPSRCPEALRSQWVEKKNAYLKTGRWEVTNASNTIPMLLIIKPRKPGDPPLLRTVFDLRARNENTHKMTSPLPDPEGILRRAARHRFRSMMDGKDAYEQIRIEPAHVDRTAVTTPDGNMICHVIQQGDCNAPATYQALMNHIFSPYIGKFMDVYLDDIIVYSNTIKEHVKHVKTIIDVLIREKLYLSAKKLHFLCSELQILGRIVTDEGIRMDPYKVDCVLNWKTPTNRDLLQGFLGSVGYLAEDIPNIRIPMGVLHKLTGDAVPFRWGYTEQRAFEDVKMLVQSARDHHRVPIDYAPNAPQVWMVTDGCATGVAGVVSQGNDWKSAKIAAFYSAKLNSAQQNYPVHEIEMLAGIETML